MINLHNKDCCKNAQLEAIVPRFRKKLEIFGNIFKVYLLFGKVVNPLWDYLYAFV